MEIFLWAVYFNAMGDLIRKSSLIKKKRQMRLKGSGRGQRIESREG
jgi:hypothetical protein